jgi:hypothetical protein
MSYGPKPRSPAERLWKKVNRAGPDECWEWQGAVDAFGYGFLHGGPLYRTGAKWVKAHRIAWEVHHGRPIPDGGIICHHCDNPPCCNPAHLYLGTKKSNAEDRARRRRGKEHRQDGEHNDNAKLTEDQVRQIIVELRRLPRRSQTSIAQEFGVQQPQISRIMRSENWAHLWE